MNLECCGGIEKHEPFCDVGGLEGPTHPLVRERDRFRCRAQRAEQQRDELLAVASALIAVRTKPYSVAARIRDLDETANRIKAEIEETQK